MKKVCKTANRYTFGWSDPVAVFGGTYKKPLPTCKRLISDLETGMIDEYTNAYIHGAAERIDEERIERSYRTSTESHTQRSSI